MNFSLRCLTPYFLLLLACPAFANNHVRVEAFGAVGDGITDDVAAFEKALAYSAANKVHVLLQAKTYFIGRTLTLDDHMALVGRGAKRTMLRFGPANEAIRTLAYKQEHAFGKHRGIRLEGFTIDANWTRNEFYRGIVIWGVDRPIVRDIRVLNVSVGEAFLFRQCRDAQPGDIEKLWAENCWYDRGPNESRGVIKVSDSRNLHIKNLTVVNAIGAHPADQRDAILVVDSADITIKGMKGRNIDSFLDAGNCMNCTFEDFDGKNIRQIPIYANNSTRSSTFRNGRFERSDFGILILTARESVERSVLDRFNVFENLTFVHTGSYELSNGEFEPKRPGIFLVAAADNDRLAPTDNIFRNIRFIDRRSEAGLAAVIEERMHASMRGKNQYIDITVDAADFPTIPELPNVANQGETNLNDLDRQLGRIAVNLSSEEAAEKILPGLKVDGINDVVAVSVTLNSNEESDTVQYVNVVVRNIMGDSFDLVIRSLDGLPLRHHARKPFFLVYEVIGN